MFYFGMGPTLSSYKARPTFTVSEQTFIKYALNYININWETLYQSKVKSDIKVHFI